EAILKAEEDQIRSSLRSQLEEAQDPIKLEYVLAVGSALSPAFIEIILQEQSEKMGFKASPLSNWAKSVQSWTYKQVLTFHQEFSLALLPEEMEAHLSQLLHSDIALVQS